MRAPRRSIPRLVRISTTTRPSTIGPWAWAATRSACRASPIRRSTAGVSTAQPLTRDVTSADVDPWPLVGIRLGLAQHFACDWRRVAFAECEELQEIRDG